MKKIVRELSSAEVLVDKLTNKSIVGIKWGSHQGEKSWIFKNKTGYSAVPLGTLDLSLCWVRATIKEYVNLIINDFGVEVFLFDSETELIQWLKS